MSRLVVLVRGFVVAGRDHSGERRCMPASAAKNRVMNGSIALNRTAIAGGPSGRWMALKRSLCCAVAVLTKAVRGATVLSMLREVHPATPGALTLTGGDSSQVARRAANGGHSPL